MKDTLNTSFRNKEKLLVEWRRFSYLVGKDEQDDRTIELQEEAIANVEKLLPFKDEQEHQHWLEVLQGYKFWEDLEDLTMEIINRVVKPSKVDEDLLLAYNQVALDVCRDSNFYDLFKVFAELSNGWVNTMDHWNDYYKEMCDDEWALSRFLEDYEEMFEKAYDKKDLYSKGFYGFETCPYCIFYKNDIESKSDLLDCMFDRYISGLDEDEELWFYQRLIKELI